MYNGQTVFWGNEPEHQSERDFLNRLRTDLAQQQVDALTLANFYLGNGPQIDFLVVTPEHLWHIELKHYVQTIVGGKNGPWKTKQADGSLQEIHGQNAYAQAASQRFALSDELGRFAEKAAGTPQPPNKKFYYWFDTLICVFPALATGSNVPSDHKVKTLGYGDLLTLLISNADQHFPWDQQRWRKFIQYLSLTPADTAPTPVLTSSDARSVVESYCHAFAGFYSRNLHELVPTPLVLDNAALANLDVLSLLREGTSIQLIGQSGSGKSHLATHTALSGLGGWVPIFVRAGLYDQRLSNLLDRSVAPLTVLTARQIF
ncbi:MAG: NERD domain-containing protein, partial [Acidobacteria bacterium]|nr:NERD domain-containing protein [Acidobacteriota bacterium]